MYYPPFEIRGMDYFKKYPKLYDISLILHVYMYQQCVTSNAISSKVLGVYQTFFSSFL